MSAAHAAIAICIAWIILLGVGCSQPWTFSHGEPSGSVGPLDNLASSASHTEAMTAAGSPGPMVVGARYQEPSAPPPAAPGTVQTCYPPPNAAGCQTAFPLRRAAQGVVRRRDKSAAAWLWPTSCRLCTAHPRQALYRFSTARRILCRRERSRWARRRRRGLAWNCPLANARPRMVAAAFRASACAGRFGGAAALALRPAGRRFSGGASLMERMWDREFAEVRPTTPIIIRGQPFATWGSGSPSPPCRPTPAWTAISHSWFNCKLTLYVSNPP